MVAQNRELMEYVVVLLIHQISYGLRHAQVGSSLVCRVWAEAEEEAGNFSPCHFGEEEKKEWVRI